jgi:hypothetical protein
VEAAGGCGLAVAGVDAVDELGEPGGAGEVGELLADVLLHGAAFELEHLEVAGDGAGDDADAGAAGGVPGAHLGLGGEPLLVGLPLAVGPLGAVLLRGDDGVAVLERVEGDVEHRGRVVDVTTAPHHGGGLHRCDSPSSRGGAR